MELKSTTSFKDIDIDAMLEHTTFDEFMKGLYANKVARTSSAPVKAQGEQKNEFESMWSSIMGAGKEEEEAEELKLAFDKQQEDEGQFHGHSLMEAQALANIRERRKRLAMSSIFDGSEKKAGAKHEEEDAGPKDLENQIDLTTLQETKE